MAERRMRLAVVEQAVKGPRDFPYLHASLMEEARRLKEEETIAATQHSVVTDIIERILKQMRSPAV